MTALLLALLLIADQGVIVGDEIRMAQQPSMPAQSLEKVEVVLTRQQTQIAGRVGDGRGDAASGWAVIAFAVDADKRGEDSRFFAVTRAGRDGKFEIAGLPAGDYFVAIADRTRDADEWRDPDLLSTLARSATRIVLLEGQNVEILLKTP